MKNKDIYRSINKDRRHRRNYIGVIIAVFVICTAIIIATIFGVSWILAKISENSGYTAPETTAPVTETEPATTAETTAPPEPVYIYKEYPDSDANAGYLVLVNYKYEYVFPSRPYLMTIYGNKTAAYKVSDTKLSLERTALLALNTMMDAFESGTGLHDVLAVSAYRDYDTQVELYAGRVEKVGLEEAAKYVAQPGFSEHHTGLALDLNVYTDSGESMMLSAKPEYDWIMENCHKYGYIRRYEADKQEITHINGEEWHFRYVGTPHAYYMKKNDLCLEEYLEMLASYTFGGGHLIFSDDDGKKWEIYTVPVSGEGTTKITLPEWATDDRIAVSGSNTGFFVITLETTGLIV